MKKLLNRFFNITYCTIFIIIIILIFFYDKIDYFKSFDYSKMLFAYGILFICLIYTIIYFVCKIFNNTNKKYLYIMWNFFLVVLLFFMAINYGFKPIDWDANNVMYNAEVIAQNKYYNLDNYYFSRHPNNIFITICISLFFRLANIIKIDGSILIILFNSIIFTFTGHVLYKISKKYVKKELAIFTYVIYLFLVGFSPWIVIHYSDQAGLWIIILSFYLYIKEKETQNIKYMFLFVLLQVLGYYIKPQIIFLLISVFIYEIINYKYNKDEIIKILKRIGITLIVIVLAIIYVKVIIYFSGFKIDKEKKFGITHYLMMGFNEERNGVWFANDVIFSSNFSSYKERKEANINEFKKRVIYYGPKGIGKLFIKKMLTNYNDGTFFWGKEGYFYGDEITSGTNPAKELLKSYYWNDGKNHIIFQSIMQSIWLSILFLNIFAFVKVDYKNEIQVLKITIIILTIFELLFEARSRYLFIYVPIYIFTCVIGFNNMINIFKIRKNDKNGDIQ